MVRSSTYCGFNTNSLSFPICHTGLLFPWAANKYLSAPVWLHVDMRCPKQDECWVGCCGVFILDNEQIIRSTENWLRASKRASMDMDVYK